MRTKLYSCVIFLFVLLQAQTLFATAPTVPASNVTFSFLDGASLRVNWTSGNGAQRLIIASLNPVTATPANGTDYLANGAFGSGFQIAPGEYVVGKTSSFVCDLSALQPATTYYFKIYEFNGTGALTEYLMTGTTGSANTVSAPTTQASAVNFTNIIGNTMKVNWTNGNGTKRLVVMRKGASVNANPVDLVNYSYSSSFGSGAQIGSGGNYVVFNGSANNITVTNLDPASTYYVAVFEANGNSYPVYLITSPATGNGTTLPQPTIPTSNISINFLETTSLRLNWTSGNGTNRIVVARAGSPVDAVPVNGVDYLVGTTAPFNTAPEISPGQKVVYDNGTFTDDISGLTPGVTYYFRVYEYDGTGTNIGYLTSLFATGSGTTLTTPTVQATNVTFSNLTSSSMQVNWTNGNGGRHIVLAKAGSPVDASPVDLVNYSYSSNFGSGAQIGSGNYVVYNQQGSTSNVNVTNLTTGVIYHFAVFEANGTNEPVYLTTSPARGSQGTIDRPTVPSSALFFSSIEGGTVRLTWTPGNGARRIIVARAGSAVDAVPVDGVDYLAGTTAPFNTAPEISPGQKVVFDNNGSLYDLSGLTPNTTYYFRIYEYDGTGAAIKYLTATYASGNFTTLSAPTTQSSNITFTNVSSNSMTVHWVSGNGTYRIVIAKAGSPVDAVPIDLVSYNTSSSYGNGSQVTPGNYVVYSGNGNSVNIINMTLNTTYYFKVMEYNGNFSPVYLTTNPAVNSITTTAQPTIPSSALGFSSIEGNSMRLSWSVGNGTNRIVVARAGVPVDAVPVNGTDYLAGGNAPFNTAPEISPGQKVVFDNNNNLADVTGLTPNTVYYFKIFEYDGTGANIGYLTSSSVSGNASTAADPTVQATSVTFTSVTSNTMTVTWTNGNGGNRMVVMRQGGPVSSNPVDLTTYSPNTAFGSGSQIGSGNYVVYGGSQTSVNVLGLTAGTTYHVAVYEYNGSFSPMYLTPGATAQGTTIGPPTTPASNGASSSITNTSVHLAWTNGSGNRRIVLMKQGSAVNATPLNNIHYSANTFFGSGAQIGSGNYVVFDGVQNNVTVTNLSANNSYYFAVFEYNDFGATTQVLTTNPATGNFNTVVLPVVLIGFEATVVKDKVKLTWATAQEQNSAYFSVERSVNGTDFYEIGRRTAKGQSTTRSDYSFEDNAPFDGDNYYRLKQVDIDGTKAYSFIVHVKFNSGKLIRNMANPVVGRLVADLYKQPSSGDHFLIYDMGGRLIKKESISNKHIDTDVTALASGMYLLEIHTSFKTEQIKFIKQ